MGEHKFNDVAKANAIPQRQVGYIKLADGIGLLGAGLKPSIGDDNMLKFAIVASVARISELVPITRVIEVELTVLGQASMADLAEKAKAALEDKPTEVA